MFPIFASTGVIDTTGVIEVVSAIPVEWQAVILVAIQLGYSWWLKNYSKMPNKWIPLVNVGVAFAYFTGAHFASGSEVAFADALVSIFISGASTAVASTGIHSVAKNLTESRK